MVVGVRQCLSVAGDVCLSVAMSKTLLVALSSTVAMGVAVAAQRPAAVTRDPAGGAVQEAHLESNPSLSSYTTC